MLPEGSAALQRALLRTKAGGGSCPISLGSSPRAFTPLHPLFWDAQHHKMPNFRVQLKAGASIPGTDPPREPPTPAHRAQREARRRPGVIEPGSFIYTVKVTSNFLRLSCSSAIKSWRGYKSAVFSPARGEGSLQWRGHLRQPLPGGTHSPLRLCK